MAATVGRLTGVPGVCLSTLGPGATNFVTAVAYAQLGAMPALFITGQKPIKKSKQGRLQIINTVEMMKPITKFTRQIIHAQMVPATVRDAFKIAMEERSGAVHIELPEDIANDDLDEAVIFEPARLRRPLAEDKQLTRRCSVLSQPRSRSCLSARVRIASLVGKHIKKTVLELGGSDPFIVLDDADIEAAAKTAVSARMIVSGQSCIAAKRFIVHKVVYKRFVKLLRSSLSRSKSVIQLTQVQGYVHYHPSKV